MNSPLQSHPRPAGPYFPYFAFQYGTIPGIKELIPRKFFVGGLSPNTTNVELKQFFCRFGIIKHAMILLSMSGYSRGVGFVVFQYETEAELFFSTYQKGVWGSLVLNQHVLTVSQAYRISHPDRFVYEPHNPCRVIVARHVYSLPNNYQAPTAVRDCSQDGQRQLSSQSGNQFEPSASHSPPPVPQDRPYVSPPQQSQNISHFRSPLLPSPPQQGSRFCSQLTPQDLRNFGATISQTPGETHSGSNMYHSHQIQNRNHFRPPLLQSPPQQEIRFSSQHSLGPSSQELPNFELITSHSQHETHAGSNVFHPHQSQIISHFRSPLLQTPSQQGSPFGSQSSPSPQHLCNFRSIASHPQGETHTGPNVTPGSGTPVIQDQTVCCICRAETSVSCFHSPTTPNIQPELISCRLGQLPPEYGEYSLFNSPWLGIASIPND